MSDREKLQNKKLKAEIRWMNQPKKMNGISFSSNDKISNSNKSEEKKSDGKKANEKFLT